MSAEVEVVGHPASLPRGDAREGLLLLRLPPWLQVPWCQMGLLFLLAAVIRWLAVLPLGDLMPTKDGQEYSLHALNLLAGRGFGAVFSINLPYHETFRAFRMPLYPIFVAAVYSWFGISFQAVRFVQVLLGAASCVLVYRIAHRLCGRLTAVLAGLLACVYPAFITYTGLLMTETLCTALVLVAVDRFLAVLEQPTLSRCVVLGSSLAGILLTRAQGIGLVAVMLFGLGVLALRQHRLRWTSTALVFTAFLILYAPWVIRNWRLFHQVVPFTTQVGAAFGIRNSAQATSGIYRPGDVVGWQAHAAFGRVGEEGDWSTKLWQSGWRFILSHPTQFLRFVGERARLFWGVNPELWRSPRRGWFRVGFYGWVLLGAFLMSRYHPQSTALLLLLVGSYAVPLWLAGNGDDRIRVPIEPFLLILSAYGIGWVWAWVLRRPDAMAPQAASAPLAPAPRPWGRHAPRLALGALALFLGATWCRAAHTSGRLMRPFDYDAYVQSRSSSPPTVVTRRMPSSLPGVPVELLDRTWRDAQDSSLDSVLGQRVTWQGGLSYNMLSAAELRSQFVERSVFLVNLNLGPRTFGDGLIVVAYDGDLPGNLVYEEVLQGAGMVAGTWHHLLVVHADWVERAVTSSEPTAGRMLADANRGVTP